LADLHATLADLCRLQAPKTDGASLAPLLADPAAAWDRPALTQVRRGGGGKKKGDTVMGYSIRTEKFRYTEWDGGKRGVQLFDYEKDPGELKNLAEDPAHAETVKKMKALMPK
jgi:uncharacterized sulfatase